jgi:SpoVK/Ycf46/Vps4 family AAA+-type ATPase
VVLFFDEVDSIGSTRSAGSAPRVDDRVLTSFMTELDGLEPRGNVLVVAATNRREAIDPALLRPGRLGDLVLEIPRPTRAAAKAILERHLCDSAPYAGETEVPSGRADVIDTALSRVYAPNGEGDIASLMFRDGTRRAVRANDLVSGAMLAQIARIATERACLRELETGDPGIRRADILEGVTTALADAAGALTPNNCQAFIAGLPQDLAVVRVEATLSTERRPHRFLTVA